MAAQESFINAMLDDAFTGTITIGLFKTGLPSITGVEVSGGSYARQTLTLSAATGKRKQTSSDATFTDLPTGQTIVAYGIYKDDVLVDERMLDNAFTADISANELNVSYYFEIPGA